MNTNFFEQLSAMGLSGDLKINIRFMEKDQLYVTVLLSNEKVDDGAAKQIQPMLLQGDPMQMDDGFFESITKPLIQTSSLFVNMSAFEESFEKAQAESKMEKEKEDKSKKEKEDRKKKYDIQMKKVTDLEELKKYGEAIGQLPKAEDFPEQVELIKKKNDELRTKHGSLSLFETE